MGGQYCPNANLLTDLVVVITGADGGIGEEVCTELAKRKAIICMACKDIENGEKVKKKILRQFSNAKICVKQLDLRSFDNVRRFVQSVGKIYCIIYFFAKIFWITHIMGFHAVHFQELSNLNMKSPKKIRYKKVPVDSLNLW